MNNRMYAGLGFVIGALAGAASAYIFTKKKYDALVKEEVESVKEAYQKMAKDLAEKNKIEKEKIFSEFSEKAQPYTEEAVEEVTEQEKPHDISEPEKTKPYENVITDHQTNANEPYEIISAEYGALDGYNLVSLNYYMDGVITDSNDEPIDHPADYIGEDIIDKLELYLMNGIYTVYVRNDTRLCDYEVFLNGTDFEQV